jgi:zinc D-Ala-D-Ala carboxypeptidase
MSKTYASWRDYPTAQWRWASFSPEEIACRGTGKLLVNEPAMDRLHALRDKLSKPLIVNSAYRSPGHNKRVGGAPKSQNLLGIAFDVRMDNHAPHAFERAARECGFSGFGHYPRSGFMHIDTGAPRRWNDGAWFPLPGKTPSFQTEQAPETVKAALLKPEVLTSARGHVSGAAVVAHGDGPVQYAFAGFLVLAAIAVAAVLVVRTLRGPAD